MKLRLRSIESKETLRVEVPDCCSLQQLIQVVGQQVPSFSSIHLSLNRKDELISSSPEDSLQSIGITSGDLIYFTVNPNVFLSGTSMVQSRNHQERRSTDFRNSPKTLTRESGIPKHKSMDHVSTSTEIQDWNSQKEKCIELDSKNGKAVDSSSQEEETLELNAQTGENIDSMEVDAGDPVLESRNPFSVPEFLRKVFTSELGDDGHDHKLLVIAIHAVLLESGFVAFNPVSQVAVDGCHLPDVWPSAAFMMSLHYTLPEIIGTENPRIDEFKSVVLKFQNLGKFLVVYGSLANGSSSTHSVSLNEDHLVPLLNVVWANCCLGLVDEISGQTGISPEREIYGFWRVVKDRLALPLLIDICDKAGLELPPCFIRLPCELKLKILESLPGVDLAKMGCVSSEMRYLVSSDDLWKQKFVEQFGDGDRLVVRGRRWKEKFARAYVIRKRKKIGSRFLFSQLGRDSNPLFIPRNPFEGYFIGTEGHVLRPIPGAEGHAFSFCSRGGHIA